MDAPLRSLEHLFQALGDSTRLRILGLLLAGEVCVCEIHGALKISQPKASRHLAYLRRSGLVASRRDGVWMHYRVPSALDPVVQRVVNASIDALLEVPTTDQDRKQFERAFGQLYVLNTPNGGSCCAPRA